MSEQLAFSKTVPVLVSIIYSPLASAHTAQEFVSATPTDCKNRIL